jgi:hypothetical protein
VHTHKHASSLLPNAEHSKSILRAWRCVVREKQDGCPLAILMLPFSVFYRVRRKNSFHALLNCQITSPSFPALTSCVHVADQHQHQPYYQHFLDLWFACGRVTLSGVCVCAHLGVSAATSALEFSYLPSLFASLLISSSFFLLCVDR